MSFFGFSNSNSIFGSSSSNTMNFISDYNAIKNGSYYKLMKAYYGGNSKIDSIVSSKSSTSTAKDSAKKLTAVEQNAEDLKNSADALSATGKKDLFKQKSVEQEDGTTKMEYDTDAIYNAVSRFVKNYNDMLESGDNVSSDSLDKAISNLMNTTKSNARNLARAGISVGANGKLSVDEATFKKGDMAAVKNLFQGTGSYGYQVSARASMIDYTAEREAAKANTYNRYGSYSNNYNYSYNSYI